MLSNEALNYINYIFIFLILAALVLCFLLVFPKNNSKTINLFTVASISFVSIVVGSLILIFTGYVADELNQTTSYSVPLYLVLLIFSIVNFFIAYSRFWQAKLGEDV